MDQPLKQILLRLKLETEGDDAFIAKVMQLHETRGNAVLQTVFQLLAGVDIPENDCPEHWRNALQHRRSLMDRLERYIDITTALSDYLQTKTALLQHPRLIEAMLFENVVQETTHDKLTGLFNRPYFDQAYSQQVSLAHRYFHDLSVIFLDIDNFKDINDTFGHLAGDEALRTIAKLIMQEKRDSDIAARYGGEEFVLLLTHTDNVSAFIFGERLRKRIENFEFHYRDAVIKLTVSGGIASFPLHSRDPEKLLHMADSAVYLAKGAGKNKIAHFKEEKRRYLRVKIQQPVLAKELNFDETETFMGMSKDICVGGILFENSNPLPLGALITVKVPVANSDPIILLGNVVRVEAFDNGRFDIGMTTSFKKMDKIANTEIASILHQDMATG
jgi:diguanylate cyclase (GGDEF)-like protein